MKLSLYTYTLYSILKEQPWSLSVKVSALGRVHCKDNYCMPKRGQRCGEVELKLVPLSGPSLAMSDFAYELLRR